MPKRWIRTQLFDKYALHQHPYLSKFGSFLLKEDLWHINRHSISTGVAIGLFCAFIPIPFQMILALFLAFLLRGNVLVSIALVWITNPITMGPIFYLCYKIGQTVLSSGQTVVEYSIDTDLIAEIVTIWHPLLLGSFIVGSIAAVLGYATVKLVWRAHIVSNLKRKRQHRHSSIR